MKKKVSLLLATLFLVGSLAGCNKSTGASANAKSIKVGLNYELTGGVATYGQGLVEGIELAFEEINKNGGVLGKQIEIIKVDNKSDNAESANVASKLATRDKVIAILGPATSGNTKAAAPIAIQNKVP
ncbi:MAG: ABC transporter substrate-binding protein, partial [Clostridium sp.]|nr:ABC transporter substrate-binding protein [Clostridium sp.]